MTTEEHARDIENRLRSDMRMTVSSHGVDLDSEVLEALVGDAMHQVEQLLTRMDLDD